MWSRLLGTDCPDSRVSACLDFAQKPFRIEGLRKFGLETRLLLICHASYQVTNNMVDNSALVIFRLNKDLTAGQFKAF